MKKAELEQRVQELEAQLRSKGEKTMETKKEFNVFDYVKTLIIRAELHKQDAIKMYSANGQVLSYLQKVGAISGYTIDTDDTLVDENNRRYVKVTLKGVNLKARALSKAGKEYNVFPAQLIGREYQKLLA